MFMSEKNGRAIQSGKSRTDATTGRLVLAGDMRTWGSGRGHSESLEVKGHLMMEGRNKTEKEEGNIEVGG